MKKASGAAICIAMMISACGDGDPTATDPRLLFEDAFEDDFSRIHVEAEGGNIARGFDAWMQFTAEQRVRLSHEGTYEPFDCDAARQYFARFPDTQLLPDSDAQLDCRTSSDPRFDFDNGRWLVEDRYSGRYWYRYWKRR